MTSRPDIAMSVDPNVSDDVCAFCKHADWGKPGLVGPTPTCALGHTPYFRSLSNYGPIWVSDCEAGELLPKFADMERNRVQADTVKGGT